MPTLPTLDDIKSTFVHALHRADFAAEPYDHWNVRKLFAPEVVDALLDLPFEPADVAYELGKRDEHNEVRRYFDAETRASHPVCDLVASALQSPEAIREMQVVFGTDLQGTNLRVEYAVDAPGFWLEPHTDLGVKMFTMIAFLSKDEDARNWGTSIYADPDTFYCNAPFESDNALVFVPGDNTFHGYEKREMSGVRKTLIVNFVGPEWRARHELAFPDEPIARVR